MPQITSPFKTIQVPAGAGGVNVNSTDPGKIITAVLPYVFGASALILLVYLTTAGLQLMFSQGDPKAVQAAQGRITTSLIGFVIVFFAFVLVRIIGQVFGVEAFKPIFGY